MNNLKYGFGRTVEMDFDNAIVSVIEELQEQGFGVLSDIDVSATLKNKLGEDMPPHRILGACNPQFAHKALTSEPSIGLLLPCNVVVRQDEQGTTHVEFMDPSAVLNLVDDPVVHEIAAEVRSRLDRVLAALQ